MFPGMDACRASSCCHGVKNAPWTEVPVVPSARAMRAVPVPVPAAAVAVVAVPLPARGVPQRRWRLWISSLQRRLTRLSIRWTNELSPHSTTNHSIFSTGFPLTGKFCAHYEQNYEPSYGTEYTRSSTPDSCLRNGQRSTAVVIIIQYEQQNIKISKRTRYTSTSFFF